MSQFPLKLYQANHLCLIFVSLHSVLTKRLIYTFVAIKHDTVVVHWLLKSLWFQTCSLSLGSACECCPYHSLCARLALSSLVFVCPLFP